METVSIANGVFDIHDITACSGEACVFHAPSEHHMRDWPIVIRETSLTERRCEHGWGHPDPDSLAWVTRVTGDGTWDIHGCDGCCGER